MKTKILSIFAALAVALSLSSCHEKEDIHPANEGVGTVSMRSMAVEVNNAEKVISRAEVDLSGFNVQIFNAEGTKMKEWKYADMPEIFSLPVGDYHVHVYSHEVKKAAWEEPYFVGDKDFSIVKDEITEIGVVTCKLANIKVSIRYSDELRKYMGDDCKVNVRVNDEGTLEYLPAETRSGYFAAVDGSTTLVAEFNGSVGGYQETLRHTATDLEPGQHRIITFKLKSSKPEVDENGNIIIDGIGIDVDVVDEDLNGNINWSEPNLDDNDRPGQEDPKDPDDPDKPDVPGDETKITITSDDVDFDAVNDIKDRVIVKIDAEYGIEHLQVTISSDNADFVASVSDLLPMSFDLAYPGDNAANFESIGFPTGSNVIGSTHIDFDISQFVPLLGSFPGTHHFQISVTDAKNKQLVKTLTFKS